MEKVIIKAMARSGKPKKIRSAGSIPGVLNGPGTASAAVQFSAAELSKIITEHGEKAKLWVEINNEKKFGFIKEIQKDPVGGKTLHVSVQLTSNNQEVKRLLPIAFHGRNELEHKALLQLQVCKSQIEVEGKAERIPDEAVADVSEKKSGENIVAVDFHLPKEIRILDPENEIYAIVKPVKSNAAEEPQEVKPAE